MKAWFKKKDFKNRPKTKKDVLILAYFDMLYSDDRTQTNDLNKSARN